MNCNNCNAKLGCSCKVRVATDGKKCCEYCLVKYEASLHKNGTPIKGKSCADSDLKIISITYKQDK